MNLLAKISVAVVVAASLSYGAFAQRSAEAIRVPDRSMQSSSPPGVHACREKFRHQIVDKGWGYYYCLANNDPERFIHCRRILFDYGNDPVQPGFSRQIVNRCMTHEEWRDRSFAEAAAIEQGAPSRAIQLPRAR